MALISVVQRIMVDKDKTLENEHVLDSIGIASLLPGPLAVNVVGQIGYRLRKGRGATVSTVGIILPAFILMVGLSWTYYAHQQFIGSNGVMAYVTGAVCAIILATGLQLFKKELSGNSTKIAMFCVALAVLIYTGNYFVTIGLLVAGAIAGILFQVQEKGSDTIKDERAEKSPISLVNKLILFALLLNQVLFFSNLLRYLHTGYLKLFFIFSGISLSLFGGGYVMIPIMESLFVRDLNWLSSKEFVDAIAFSQATPGPILISATFIGYKLAGFWGALLATAAIFAPSVYLTVMVAKIVNRHQANRTVKNILAGVKTVVVALIIISAYRLTANQQIDALLISIIAICFLLNYRYKVSPVYLILGTILTSTLIHIL